MTAKPRIVIVGAGIGGLTAAIALRRVGFEVSVFERAPELKEIGAGFALSSNAVRVLRHLGLMEKIIERGTVIKEATSYTRKGNRIAHLPTNLSDVPSVCLHRADLQEVLLSALPEQILHLGEEFVEFEMRGGCVSAHFRRGGTAAGEALIGADGLRSKVRAQLIGDGEPVYRGYQCWRGVTGRFGGNALTETFGPGLCRLVRGERLGGALPTRANSPTKSGLTQR